jgi:hypothetical protein
MKNKTYWTIGVTSNAVKLKWRGHIDNSLLIFQKAEHEESEFSRITSACRVSPGSTISAWVSGSII